jgi:hypothetical protein
MVWFLAPCVVVVLAISASFRMRLWTSNNSPSENHTTHDHINPSWPLQDFQTHKLVVPVLGVSGGETSAASERTLTVEKLSSYPPIFRVKNFLTPAECTTLRRLAVEQGLQPGYVDSDDGLLVDEYGTRKKKKMGIFDRNEDGRLSVNELIRMVDDFFESHVSQQDIKSMLATINLLSLLEESDDETISIQDFIQSDTAAMRHYFKQLIAENPSKRSRHSEMAWLSSNQHSMNDEGLRVMESIRQRVALLTRLPEHVVHQDMEMQVVHYEPTPENEDVNESKNEKNGSGGGGHYTAHFDSLAINEELPCCHITNRRPPCRACRMATVLYSLAGMGNVAGSGGHTAFPLATDESGLHHTAETIEDWRMSSASRESSYCAEDGPGLRIQPELGQAILWYNHDLSHLRDNPSDERPSTSTAEGTAASPALLGDLDRSTIHAGCPASKQHRPAISQQDPTHKSWNAPGKWIANHWIEASNVPGEDEEHYERRIKKRKTL